MSLKVVTFNDLKQQNNIKEGNIELEIEEDENENDIKNKKPKIRRNPNAISYDDILNSLGFGVSNGTLYKNTANYTPTTHEQKPHTSLDPRIKNSAIYNKYFKNYKDPIESSVPVIPLTKDELREQAIKRYIDFQQAKKRISQIKSKKMFYSTQNIAIATQQNPVNLNKFFIFPNGKK